MPRPNSHQANGLPISEKETNVTLDTSQNQIFPGQMNPAAFRGLVAQNRNEALERRAKYLADNPQAIPCCVPGCQGLTTADQRWNMFRFNPAMEPAYRCPRNNVHARLFPSAFRISSARGAGIAPDTDELDADEAPTNGREAVTA